MKSRRPEHVTKTTFENVKPWNCEQSRLEITSRNKRSHNYRPWSGNCNFPPIFRGGVWGMEDLAWCKSQHKLTATLAQGKSASGGHGHLGDGIYSTGHTVCFKLGKKTCFIWRKTSVWDAAFGSPSCHTALLSTHQPFRYLLFLYFPS